MLALWDVTFCEVAKVGRRSVNKEATTIRKRRKEQHATDMLSAIHHGIGDDGNRNEHVVSTKQAVLDVAKVRQSVMAAEDSGSQMVSSSFKV